MGNIEDDLVAYSFWYAGDVRGLETRLMESMIVLLSLVGMYIEST